MRGAKRGAREERAADTRLADELCGAILLRSIPKARAALDKGADPKAPDQHGTTALIVAAAHGFLEGVGLLLGLGDPLFVDEEGETALMMAAMNGHAHCLDALLPASDPAQRDLDGRTALMLAARAGHPECVAKLLAFPAAAACAGAADKKGADALTLAVRCGRLDSVALLLPFCDPKAAGAGAADPLELARQLGLEDIALAIGSHIEASEIAKAAKAAEPGAKAAMRL